MYSYKQLHSLNVLSLYEGEIVGKVNKLHLDKKLKKLVALELIFDSGAVMMLSIKNVYRFGKHAIIIKNNQAISIKDNNQETCLVPFGSKAYSINGEFLGIVEEIIFSDKFVVEKIILEGNKTVDAKLIASCGKNAIIFNSQEEKINIKNLMPIKEPKNFAQKDEKKVSVMPVENDVVEVGSVKPLVQSSDFLIGRVCGKDIYNFNNEILVKANAVINKKIIKDANKFGKLRELMLYSK